MEEKQERRSRVKIRKERRRKIINIIRYVILMVIVVILLYMAYGIYKEVKIRTISSAEEIENTQSQNIVEAEVKNLQMPTVPVEEKYLGYKVDCRLEVPKIKLNTNVLSNYSSEGLEVCASKYYGPDANEIGNYCIAGHNYQKENMFNHLIDLEIGDSVFLTDNQNGIVEYQVYDIYKVKPENTEPLSQETGGKKELTLITCVNYSRNRLVIKATEKEENYNE